MRTTSTYKLMPTPEQERTVETVVWRCRDLYNAGLEERKTAWEQCRVSGPVAMQSAHVPGIKEVRPAYCALNAPVLQEVLHRLEKAVQAVFRRLKAGEQPGSPRFQGQDRSTRFT